MIAEPALAAATRRCCAPATFTALLTIAAGLAVVLKSHAATPSYTAAQASRGAQLYRDACAVCHGNHAEGSAFGPPLIGEAHALYWQGKTAEDMLNYMNSTMPPAEPGLLGLQSSADVLAFLLKANGSPLGDKEIPADPAAVRAFTPFP